MIQFDEDKQNKKLAELRKEEEIELLKTLAEKYGTPYINLARMPVNMDALRVVSEREARDAGVAPFHVLGKKIDVAVRSPNDERAKAALKKISDAGFTVGVFLTDADSLQKIWALYKDLSFAMETKAGALDISTEEINTVINKVKTIKDVEPIIKDALTSKKGYRISRIVEIILAGALATNASDVHIEPEETYVRLRYRLDGVLADVLTFDRDTYSLIISRVKLLSGLKLNIRADAQDGRFSVVVGDTDIEIRTSILPGAYGESIVLRVLNPKTIAVPLEELGINPRLLSILTHEIGKPNGMILTTGPTGSGKTTTLYAFLKKVHTPGVKIITIEDPIEYHLPGIVQTQVEPEKGYTFLEGLRSALRQDPDIIMVGEIRDRETAEIAVNSALTGHLVFSTLHTNNAAGSFPRLIDLGVNPKIITSAINIAMAQRLVRRLCLSCRKRAPIQGADKTLIERMVKKIEAKGESVPNKTTMWVAAGCGECNRTGYRGRIGLYEAIRTDEAIEKIVRENPSEREIQTVAAPQHILGMDEDGILKVLAGVTSLEELRRVVDLSVL